MSLLAASFVDADTFLVAGDYISDFVVNRKIRASCGGDGYKYTVVTSASYASPNSTINLTADSDDITSNLTGVDWSVVKPGTAGNIPLLHHRDEDTGGLDFGWPTKPCNSKGNAFATVQGAIDDLDGDGWVSLPAASFGETLVIDENNVVLFGAGWASIIDGGTAGDAITMAGNNCVVRDLQCRTTPGGGEAYDALKFTGSHDLAFNVYISGSDDAGITMGTSSAACRALSCYINNTDGDGVILSVNGPHWVESCHITNAASGYGINVAGYGDNSVLTSNIIDTTGNDGIYIHADAENCVVDGNRITNWTNEAIDDDSGTSTIGDNDLT